jgi:ribosomal protein S18 acetylase RimI-like enzyme
VLYAAETGAARAVLQVREDNARAIGIYLNAGMRVTRRMENHYPTGCPTALEMELVLAAPAAGGAA